MNNIFRERMRYARQTRGLSQAYIAKMSGYTSRASINKIELGKVDVPLSKVKLFASALRVSPAWLLGFDKENKIVLELHPVYKTMAKMSDAQLDQLQAYAEFLLKR